LTVKGEVTDEEAAEFFAEERRRRHLASQISKSFRPSAPIDQRDLLAGRAEQIETLADVLDELGQHALIYGERGVGKTSFAKVLSTVWNDEDMLIVYVTCDGADDYSSVWAKVFDEIRLERVRSAVGFAGEDQRFYESVLSLTSGSFKPNDVRSLLRQLTSAQPIAIFIDEFDQIVDETARAWMADTIKTLSDQAVPATLVLIGVADSVEQLITEHQSVERALFQVLMPRLDAGELKQIVVGALEPHGVKVQPPAMKKIVGLSQGLPHYTHLLGQYAGVNAVLDGRMVVTPDDVLAAVTKAISKTRQSTQNLYLEAIASSQQNMFAEVVLACALAARDELGYFSPADVRVPLSEILDRSISMGNFVRHLNALCEETRGPLLSVKGVPRRYRYRFKNPLIQPYVVMKGLADEMIDAERV
jgi:hypothetical protein